MTIGTGGLHGVDTSSAEGTDAIGGTRSAAGLGDPRVASPFTSLLQPALDQAPALGSEAEPLVGSERFADLHLDQIATSIAGGREESERLNLLLRDHICDLDTIRYRQEVFRDLDDPEVAERVKRFAAELRNARSRLEQLPKVENRHSKHAWILEAASIYSAAVRAFAEDMASLGWDSRGLRSFERFLSGYVTGPTFASLESDTRRCKQLLAGVTYDVRVRGGHVEVSRHAGEPDYSQEVQETFERFAQGAAKDYQVRYRSWPVLGHVGDWILDLVARLYPDELSELDQYCQRHAGFFDPAIRQFERDVQFYLAYIDHMAPMRSAGLSFCYPELSPVKDILATETFDLALAATLTRKGEHVVTNDFHLCGGERIIVVSGPNQGGKTTFARTFGQLHHLASVGLPVPGRSARLATFDNMFTHFEREEQLDAAGGKLEHDVSRIRSVLDIATSSSIIILNEIFTSTTLHDSRFLGTKVLQRIIELDLLSVYVTFVDELASLDDSIVSMVSTIVPEDPAQRTYKVVRAPADGLAYALAIAAKHKVTYDQLAARLTR